jgi:hypothetical protein
MGAGECFELHNTECIRQAWKYEGVRGRQMRGQKFVLHQAKKTWHPETGGVIRPPEVPRQ